MMPAPAWCLSWSGVGFDGERFGKSPPAHVSSNYKGVARLTRKRCRKPKSRLTHATSQRALGELTCLFLWLPKRLRCEKKNLSGESLDQAALFMMEVTLVDITQSSPLRGSQPLSRFPFPCYCS
jgi:hypothetical protein